MLGDPGNARDLPAPKIVPLTKPDTSKVSRITSMPLVQNNLSDISGHLYVLLLRMVSRITTILVVLIFIAVVL